MVYLFLLAHLVADFVLQPLWLVRRKQHWNGLCLHAALVLLCMLALIPLEPATHALWPAMLGIGLVHLAADRWKVRYADSMLRPPIVPFLLDQCIHLGTIIVALKLSLPATQIWSLHSSPLAVPALYAICYLLAACAAPIALIVAFDPTFQHAQQAAAARTRSLLIAVVVISLALFAGPLALPATLVGLVVVTRRPASAHPLDTPGGLLAVLMIAALLGAILSMML